AERSWHPTQDLRAMPGGESELTLRLNDLREVAAWVLSWGEHAWVVSPPELVESVRNSHAAAARRYAKPDRRPRASTSWDPRSSSSRSYCRSPWRSRTRPEKPAGFRSCA
ncbi:MAG: WYL domain-containing protein, partial [Proteobacteria bacterium]|nr:WYL domain-containing protein [Pseudomonadota bacterium]